VLIVSATGIHALMSFTVTRRTREIGIRAALFGLGSARELLILVGADGVALVAGLVSCALPLRRAPVIDSTGCCAPRAESMLRRHAVASRYGVTR
jgi:hypothetical protein